MEIKITINELKDRGLKLIQYILLWGIYYELKIEGLVIQDDIVNDLVDRSFIHKQGSYWALNPLGLELFEPKNGTFDEFVEIFPTRVSDAAGVVRVLSPASTDTLAGSRLRRKWYTITKNNKSLQDHILACLKEEVRMRKMSGNLYWMRNAETWLNKATWEDYEYLLETKTIAGVTQKNDGVIRL